MRRWRPDLVTVIESPGFAEELAAEVNRADETMLLIAPMPAVTSEQPLTRIGLVLPRSFDARRPKRLISSLLGGLTLSPLTRLVGGWVLEPLVEQKLRAHRDFAYLYLDIDNFKYYNDLYGVAKGDEVIKALGAAIVAAVRQCGTPSDIPAHIGGDDFALLTAPDNARAVAERIIADFDRAVPALYSDEDRSRGKVVVVDRSGEPREVDFMSLSICAVLTTQRPIASYPELCGIIAELKAYAKRQQGSIYVEERRRGDGAPAP